MVLPTMSMQNIYDDKIFFDGYKKLRDNRQGFNDVIEQPAIKTLINDLQGKTILDIGCGFGDFCRYIRLQGAENVVGIDPSANMINVAKAQTNDNKIEYLQVPVENFQSAKNNFDLIVSSLAFHYIEDFRTLVEKLHLWLKPNGKLIFSIEHPICTAHPNAVLGSDGSKDFHPVYNYRDETMFEQTWFVEGVKKYHRTISSYFNTLVSNGFVITKILEPMPTDQEIKKCPNLGVHKIRPPLLVISSIKAGVDLK